MFTIYGGKAAFDQWDQGQRVTNPAMKAGDKVIFTNCTGETHPMKAYTYEGAVVCDVPNDLLMKASPILVDLCGSFEFRTRLLVRPAVKPEGYVYEDNTAYPQESTGGGSGTVKSVNGVEPDESGDVKIEAGGGGVTWLEVSGSNTDPLCIDGRPITFTEFEDIFAKSVIRYKWGIDDSQYYIGSFIGYRLNGGKVIATYVDGSASAVRERTLVFAEE